MVTRPASTGWGDFADDDIAVDLSAGGWNTFSLDAATGELRFADAPGSNAEVIGVIDATRDGRDGAALEVHLGKNASNEAVSELVRHVTFGDADFDLEPGQLVVLQLTITDAKGASAQGMVGMTQVAGWPQASLVGVPELLPV
jgi:hypothetical protein